MKLDRTIALLEGIGTHECAPWRTNILRRHIPIADYLAVSYQRRAKAEDYRNANLWLNSVASQLKLARTGLTLASEPDRLVDYCGAKSKNLLKEIHELVRSVGRDMALRVMRDRVALMGIELPLGDEFTKDELIAALARISDEKWLRHQLRPMQWRQMENFLRSEGHVSKANEIYLSDFSLQRRLDQKKANRRILESLEAENQEGQTYSLDELADLSPSNPIIRRNELMVRARGFEEFAKASETPMKGVFYTLTCPSRFHASGRSGVLNPKYDGSSPRDAQKHLNTTWARTRAAFARADINPFGMRIVEPHHDGTPHWHLLLFLPANQTEQAHEIFRRYAMEVDGDEPGADKYRFKPVEIDPNKGSATGYIAKYIAKNIDGAHVEADHYGRNAIESAIRIEAWASINGIRQFQQIGGASVTVYRELRRLEANDVSPGLLQQLREAADSGDWGAYNELMGGMICPRKERPLRPYMIERKERNRYGETVKALKGIWFGPAAIVTRIHEWTIRQVRSDGENANSGVDGVGFGAAASNAPPGACAPLEYCQ